MNIGVTTRCNFTCGFCWGRHLPQGDLTLERFVLLLDALPNLRYVDLTGEGEPLLNPDFLAMVSEAKARNLRVGFYTNGSLLSRFDLDSLLDAGVDAVTVSLESVQPALFQQIRGGKFSIVREGLERLMSRRRERGLEKPSVQLAVTFLKDTVEDFEAIVSFYQELGLDGGIEVQALNTMSGYARWYTETIQGQFVHPARAQERFDEVLRLPQIRKTGRGLNFGEAIGDGGGVTCPWLERGLFIRHDGLVSPCCVLKSDKDALGRIGEESWRELREVRAELRDTLRRGEVPSRCSECDIARTVARLHAERKRAAVLERAHELEELKTTRERLAREVEHQRKEVAALRGSLSWAVSAPLRWGLRWLRGY